MKHPRSPRAPSHDRRCGSFPACRLWIAVTAVLFAACGPSEDSNAPSPRVEVMRPLVREIVDWNEYTGRLKAVKSVEVRPRVSGYLEAIHFTDGAIVDAGDLLFVIDPRPYLAVLAGAHARVTSATAQMDLARLERGRAERLLERKSISREEFDRRETTQLDVEAEVQAAAAAEEAARLDVEFTEVRAPIGGRVGDRAVDVGNLISGGSAESTVLTTIVSLDPIYCYFDADERDVLAYSRMVQTGERASGRENAYPVLLNLADEKGFPHLGRLDFIDNRIDPSTGTMRARAIFPNPDHLLVPGLFGRVRIVSSGRYDGLLIPDRALASDQSQQYVFVVNADGVAEYRVVETGPRLGGLRVVRKGIGADDRVVVSGLQQVRPEMRVEAVEVPTEAEPEELRFVDVLSPPVAAVRPEVATKREPNPNPNPNPETETETESDLEREPETESEPGLAPE